MNVLMMPSLYHPHLGGLEIATGNLCREFVARGHRVEVLTTRWPRELAREDTIEGIRVRRLPFVLPTWRGRGLLTSPIRFVQCWLGFERVLRSGPYDVVNLHYLCEPALYAGLCCRSRGLPIVASTHGSDIEALPPGADSPHGRLAQRTLGTAAAITANSCSLAETVCRLMGGAPRQGVTVIGNGVRVEEFDCAADASAVPASPFVLGVGSLKPVKGFDLLIRAFTPVVRRVPELRLVLVGQGDEEAGLRRLAAECGISASVIFVGRVPHQGVAGFLQRCEFLVVPSQREGFGIVALEAMASRKAVVATAVGGLLEIVSDGTTGLLVKERTPEVLAAAMLRLLDHPQLALQLGRTGRQVVESRFTWESAASRYLEVFRSVLRPAAGCRTNLAGDRAQADGRRAACAPGDHRFFAGSSRGPI
ncbi:MAG TPA: glycosyltransferase family 4 protein [Verrucomicrobiae bacterium]|nr:glycosyltransferase family 4 protein [Verrucomicrobiae bacterium]